MVSDPGQHVGKPSLGIDVVEPSRLNQRQHDCGALAAAIRRGLIMPGVWGKKLRSHIRSIHCFGALRSSLPISFTMAAGI
jgi:hypothetical protein